MDARGKGRQTHVPTAIPCPWREGDVLVHKDTALWSAAYATLVYERLPLKHYTGGYYVIPRAFVNWLRCDAL